MLVQGGSKEAQTETVLPTQHTRGLQFEINVASILDTFLR